MLFIVKHAAFGLRLSIAIAGIIIQYPCKGAESSPLRITGSSGASLLPNTNSNEMQIERLLRSLGPMRTPSAPADNPWSMPPPSSSTPFRNPKLQEFIDRQKNWIFVTPEMQNQSYLNNQDSLSAKVGSSSTGSKSTVEQYWDMERSKLPTQQREFNDLSSSGQSSSENSGSSLGATGFESHSLSLNSSLGKSGSLSNSINGYLGKGIGNAGSLTPRSSITLFPVSENYASGITKDSLLEKAKAEEFERILRPTSVGSLKTSNNDPINTASDSTRQNLQPILPGAADEFAVTPSAALNATPSRGVGFLGSLDIPAPKSPRTSLNPAFANGANSGWIQPKPAVLELPKRRL